MSGRAAEQRAGQGAERNGRKDGGRPRRRRRARRRRTHASPARRASRRSARSCSTKPPASSMRAASPQPRSTKSRKRVGLTRAAVYYYVEGQRGPRLPVLPARVPTHGGRPGARARARHRRSRHASRHSSAARCRPSGRTAAVVSEIAYLSDAMRAIVEAEHAPQHRCAARSFVRRRHPRRDDSRLRCARRRAGHLRHRQLDRAVAGLGRQGRRCRVRAAHGRCARRSARARARALADARRSAAGST